MKKRTSCGPSSIDYFAFFTLQETIDWISKLNPQEKITPNLLFNCAASNLIPLLLYYDGDLHLETLDNISNTPNIVGSYSYKGMIEIQDYKLGIERPFNNFTTHKVMPLAIDLLKPSQGSQIVTEAYLQSPYYFSPYLHIPDESDQENSLHYSDGCFLEISELKFDSKEIIFAVDMLKQQIKSRHLASGRYTVEEASLLIAEATDESRIDIEQMLFSAIQSLSLPAHHSGRSSTIKLQLQQQPHLIYSGEIFWDDLNEWLIAEIPRLIFKFPKPTKQVVQSENTDTVVRSTGDWQEQARFIADECFDRDTIMGCRDSLGSKNPQQKIVGGYAYRVMEIMQQRGIKGPRGIIDNPGTIMREALQGKKWWANKLK